VFAEEVKINVDCELVVMAGVIASKVRKQRGAALKDKEDDPQAAKILNVSIVIVIVMLFGIPQQLSTLFVFNCLHAYSNLNTYLSYLSFSRILLRKCLNEATKIK